MLERKFRSIVAMAAQMHPEDLVPGSSPVNDRMRVILPNPSTAVDMPMSTMQSMCVYLISILLTGIIPLLICPPLSHIDNGSPRFGYIVTVRVICSRPITSRLELGAPRAHLRIHCTGSNERISNVYSAIFRSLAVWSTYQQEGYFANPQRMDAFVTHVLWNIPDCIQVWHDEYYRGMIFKYFYPISQGMLEFFMNPPRSHRIYLSELPKENYRIHIHLLNITNWSVVIPLIMIP